MIIRSWGVKLLVLLAGAVIVVGLLQSQDTPEPTLEMTPIVSTPLELPPATIEPVIPTQTLILSPTMTATDLLTTTQTPTLDATTTSSLTATQTSESLPAVTATLMPEPLLVPLFTDTFDQVDSINWSFGGGWGYSPIPDGQALRVYNSDAPLTWTGQPLDDVAAEAQVIVDYGTAFLSVRQSASGSYTLSLDNAGVVSLWRAGMVVSQGLMAPTTAGQWRKIRLSAIGSVVRVSIDDVPLLTYVDANPLPAGQVAVHAFFMPLPADYGTPFPPVNTLQVDAVVISVPATSPALIVTATSTASATATAQQGEKTQSQAADGLAALVSTNTPTPINTASPSPSPSPFSGDFVPSATSVYQPPYVARQALAAALPTRLVSVGNIATLQSALATANPPGGCIEETIIQLTHIAATPFVGNATQFPSAYGNNAFASIRCSVTINGSGATGSILLRPTVAAATGTPYRFFLVEGPEVGWQGHLTLNNIQLRNGYAVQTGGGAILSVYGGWVTLNRSQLLNNTVAGASGQPLGGGVYIYRGILEVFSSIIRSNRNLVTINTVSVDGGGLAVIESSMVVQNTILENNASGRYGNNVYVQGSGSMGTINGSCVIITKTPQAVDVYSNITAPQFGVSVTPNSTAPTAIIPAPLNAANSWWGAASGPRGTPYASATASGASVNNGVAYVPYLTVRPGCATPSPTPPAVASLALVNIANGTSTQIVGISNFTTPTAQPVGGSMTAVVQANATMLGAGGGVNFEIVGTQSSTNFDTVPPYQSLPLSLGRSVVVVAPYYEPNTVATPGATRVVYVNIATPTFTPTATPSPYIAAFAIANASITPTIYTYATPAAPGTTPQPLVFNLAQYSLTEVRVLAVPMPTSLPSGGIVFSVNGTASAADKIYPYLSGTLRPGSYVIGATPYGIIVGTPAVPGMSGMMAVQIVNYTLTPTPTPYVQQFVISNSGASVYGTMTPIIVTPAVGAAVTLTPIVINAAQYPGVQIEAITTPGNLTPGGMVFTRNGTPVSDTSYPYAMTLVPNLTPYRIGATPYGRPTAAGVAPGKGGLVAVNVVNQPTWTVTPSLTPTPTATIGCSGLQAAALSVNGNPPQPQNGDSCVPATPYISQMYIVDINGTKIIPLTPFPIPFVGPTPTAVVINMANPLYAAATAGVNVQVEMANVTEQPYAGSVRVDFNVNGGVNSDILSPYQSSLLVVTPTPYTVQAQPVIAQTSYPGVLVNVQIEQVCALTSTITKIVYRAPITFNPPTGLAIPRANPQWLYIADRQFTDYKGFHWYRIIRVENSSARGINDQPDVASGAWIKSDGLTEVQGEGSCASLPVANEYDIQQQVWNTFTGVFTQWPLDVARMCEAATSPKEFHALGFTLTSISYPRNRHSGVDFFVPNLATDVNIYAMSNGIVVGIGVQNANGSLESESHAIWGATHIEDNKGYSVIVRHGHLYTLYGHLATVDPLIWVGKAVTAGTVLGVLGKENTRHLHVEVHSYGPAIDATSVPDFADIDANGVLPAGSGYSSNEIVAPYIYDVAQFLPDPVLYPTQQPSFATKVATSNLTPIAPTTENNGRADIEIQNGCTFGYIARLPADSVIDEVNGYRAFIAYGLTTRTIPSPLTQTTPPAP